MPAIYVHKATDIPNVEHWAIITSASVHVPAQGVWAPGHGYPEHDEKFIEYEAFLDKAEFEREMLKRVSDDHGHTTTRGVHVSEVFVAKPVVSLASTK